MQNLKISVVTVCYNMAPYIEQTMRSVLEQDYPNLEYIVIDGGSTDGTQQIIERYRDKLAYYVSEPDSGMYDALAKGFAKATGDVFAWLNADDIYFPHTLKWVNEVFVQNDDVRWLGGRYAFLNESGTVTKSFPKCNARRQGDIQNGWCRNGVLGNLQQESMFWRSSLYKDAGGLNSSYRYAGDFELWTRFAQHSALARIKTPLAAFRIRRTSLSKSSNKFDEEVARIIENKKQYPSFWWRAFERVQIIIQLMRMMRYSKVVLFEYNKNSHSLVRHNTKLSASNHTLWSLLTFKMPK